MTQTQAFMAEFGDSYVQTFDDSKRGQKHLVTCRPLAEWKGNTEGLVDLNRGGAGVYFTPNPCKGGRMENNVSDLRWLYVDIDGGNKDAQFDRVAFAPLAPTAVVESKSGLHLYFKLKGQCTVANWKIACQGLRAYFGGDESISSTNEVLRVPGFDHLKVPSEPFRIRLDRYDPNISYTVHEVIQSYPVVNPIESYAKQIPGSTLEKIKAIPIMDVLARLKVDVRKGFVFENDEQTSAHVSKEGNFYTRFSGKGGNGGSTIDAVMMWGKKSLPEAIQWLKKEWGFEDEKPADKPEDIMPEKPAAPSVDPIKSGDKPFTWGTPSLDEFIPCLERTHFVVLAASGGAGKTAYTVDIGLKNQELGHKVLFLSLEMTQDDIETRLAQQMARIRMSEWRARAQGGISKEKEEKYFQIKEEFRNKKNFKIMGLHDQAMTSEAIMKIIAEEKPDLAIVDNFGEITVADGKHQLQHEHETMKAFHRFCGDYRIPVIMLHHTTGRRNKNEVEHARGSEKINDLCTMMLLCRDNKWTDEMNDEQKAEFHISVDKARFWSKAVKTVYKLDGTFYDLEQYRTYNTYK